MHKIISNLTNYTCGPVLTCITGLSRQRNWYDSSKLLDEQQIKESGGHWKSLLPLPAFSALESGSVSRVNLGQTDIHVYIYIYIHLFFSRF